MVYSNAWTIRQTGISICYFWWGGYPKNPWSGCALVPQLVYSKKPAQLCPVCLEDNEKQAKALMTFFTDNFSWKERRVHRYIHGYIYIYVYIYIYMYIVVYAYIYIYIGCIGTNLKNKAMLKTFWLTC